MQCEFSKAELITLDLAVMDKAMTAKQLIANMDTNARKKLEASITRLDTLHDKLNKLIEQEAG